MFWDLLYLTLARPASEWYYSGRALYHTPSLAHRRPQRTFALLRCYVCIILPSFWRCKSLNVSNSARTRRRLMNMRQTAGFRTKVLRSLWKYLFCNFDKINNNINYFRPTVIFARLCLRRMNKFKITCTNGGQKMLIARSNFLSDSVMCKENRA